MGFCYTPDMLRLLILFSFFLPVYVFAFGTTTVRQGDVAEIDLPNSCTQANIKINNLGNFPVFNFQNKKVLAVPVDIHSQIKTFTIENCDKASSSVSLSVIPREKIVETFVIPKEKGGNTVKNAQKVTTAIINDASVFLKAWTNKKQLWTESFALPVSNPVITDTYGYIRDSQSVTILHKGIDFHADIGTPVFAMNRGVVRYTGKLQAYGDTIIVDHGRGLQTVYLHLSKILVKQGTLVLRNQLIAESGNTGFVTGPHLHLSIRMSGMSIDPESFLKIFGEKSLSQSQ